MREKSCLICGTSFTPMNTAQLVCTAQCAIQYAVAKREKKRAQEERIAARESKKIIRLERERLKTRAEHAKDAQTAFNAYIRCRDKNEPCISCGRYHEGQWHAGHYRSVGAMPALRFDESNVHKQCSVCNNHKSGNVVEYRLRLLEKIGHKALDWIEGHHEPKKYTITELKTITATYRQKLRDMQNDI